MEGRRNIGAFDFFPPWEWQLITQKKKFAPFVEICSTTSGVDFHRIPRVATNHYSWDSPRDFDRKRPLESLKIYFERGCNLWSLMTNEQHQSYYIGFVMTSEVVLTPTTCSLARGRARIFFFVIAVFFLIFDWSTQFPRWGEKVIDTGRRSVMVFLCSLICTRTPLFFLFHDLSRDSSSTWGEAKMRS